MRWLFNISNLREKAHKVGSMSNVTSPMSE
jgi:hypothetical protein